MVEASQLEWIVVVGGLFAFWFSFGIGANDVANAFASSVGSKALTLRQAVFIAAIFEFLGAFLLGAQVTSTIKSGITDVAAYQDDPTVLMLGFLAALISSALFIQGATAQGFPVSTTHTIVGSIVGFALAAKGPSVVEWPVIGTIVLSWIASPLLSGILSVIFFFIVRKYVLRQENPVSKGLKVFPILAAAAVFVYTFFIIFKGSPALNLKARFNSGEAVGISLGTAVVAAVFVYFVINPYVKKKIDQFEVADSDAAHGKNLEDDALIDVQTGSSGSNEELNGENGTTTDLELSKLESSEEIVVHQKWKDRVAQKLYDQDLHSTAIASDKHVQLMRSKAEVFDAKTEKLFSYLQVFSAVLDSFGHGANDVANALGPFSAIITIFQTGSIEDDSPVQIWVLAFGGFGIVAGLLLYGYRIIQEIGIKLINITPSRGFAIELATALAVVSAARAGIPVSTTQCQIGATVGVGLLEPGSKKDSVNWKIVIKSVFGWVLTLIISALISAAVFSFAFFSPSRFCSDAF